MRVGDRVGFSRGSVLDDTPFGRDVAGEGVIENVWKYGDVWAEVRTDDGLLVMVWPDALTQVEPPDTPAETKTRP